MSDRSLSLAFQRWILFTAMVMSWTILLVANVRGDDQKTLQRLEHFEKKIRPVLVKHCYACHSSDAVLQNKLKGNLQLDTREGTLAGGESGAAVVPGKPQESLLIAAMKFDGLEMPPDGQLPPATIADFEAWILDGAFDPRDGKATAVKPPLDWEKARDFWSLQPLKAPPLPQVQNTDWPASVIDFFILARLESAGLAPSAPANKAALFRRLSFDLTGLPPAPESLQNFLDDDSPNAIATAVDRLLDSPHFGERWGRHWLDVARYSESCGSTRNMVWHHAWRYRDYVIDAFNDDLPFDQFLREQIAGDFLAADLPTDAVQERARQQTALGFLALGPKALDEAKREVFRMDLIDEQIDTVSRAFLGLSVSCARCHDHKFDPIPTRDYYALAGIFRSTNTLYGLGPKGIKGKNDSQLLAIGPSADLADAAATHLQQVADQTQARNDARSDRYRVVREVADLKRQLSLPNAASATNSQTTIEEMESEIKEWDAKIKELDQKLAALIDNPPPQPDYAMSACDQTTPEDCKIHIRGETTNLGEVVPRGVLQVLDLPLPRIGMAESGRRQLAHWMSHPDNPLTPRVFVNRIWLHLFGRGLVTTPDDFGINGARPSHPELLDHLAIEFVADGWSVKRLIRRLVLSKSYQQSSDMIIANQDVDPENEWLWRMKPRRLDAESFRDTVLMTAGQFDGQKEDRSVVGWLNTFRQDEFVAGYELSSEQLEHNRRSVYLPIVRGKTPELLRLFDFADNTRPVGQRDETIVPAQTSYLVNSPWMIAQATGFAKRLQAVSDDDRVRIEYLYKIAYARLPTKKEIERGMDFLAKPVEPTTPSSQTGRSGDSPGTAEELTGREAAWIGLAHAVLASAEFRYIP